MKGAGGGFVSLARTRLRKGYLSGPLARDRHERPPPGFSLPSCGFVHALPA